MVLKRRTIRESLNLLSIAVFFMLLCIALMLPSETSAQGFFGPKDYDDCILQNMRGVTSDTAAGLVHRACLSKFPKADTPNTNKQDTKDELTKVAICEVFWDGRKFSKGTPKSGFTTHRFQEYGVENLHVSIPDEMDKSFQGRKSKFDTNDPNDPWHDFFRHHYTYTIRELCSR